MRMQQICKKPIRALHEMIALWVVVLGVARHMDVVSAGLLAVPNLSAKAQSSLKAVLAALRPMAHERFTHVRVCFAFTDE